MSLLPAIPVHNLDEDECELAESCPSPSKCRNTWGSYECYCPRGFEENGNDCTGECSRPYRIHSCVQCNLYAATL